jgi:hypothetical protein
MIEELRRRSWVPDIEMVADQLVDDFLKNPPDGNQGALDCLSTLLSWQETASDHGEKFEENDYISLVQELAWRCAHQIAEAGYIVTHDGTTGIPDDEETSS